MIYTTYFAKLKVLPRPITPVSIALYPPKGYNGLTYTKLAPPQDLLDHWKMHQDMDYYTETYNKSILANLDPQEVNEELMKLAHNERVALVCYEAPDKFCHRHLVSRWLNDAGIDAIEIML